MSSFANKSDVSIIINGPIINVPININVPSSTNQDRGRNWTIGSSRGDIDILLVADGHGINGTLYSEFAVTWLDDIIKSESIDWEQEDLTETLRVTILSLETKAKEMYRDRYGGTTLSLFIRRGSVDNWVVNLGDSEVVMFDKFLQTHTILSEAHCPSNINEVKRMKLTHPDTVFEYDKQVKRGPILHVYEQVNEEWVKKSIPTSNVYYKNVESDFSMYFGDGVRFRLSTTRSIGDFHFKESFGASAEPYIRKLEPLTENQVVFIATDGFWDCWKYSEVTEFLQNKSLDDLEKVHVEKADGYFGSSKDDTFLYII
jgi:serine/threonine protein phosphatase PrpC